MLRINTVIAVRTVIVPIRVFCYSNILIIVVVVVVVAAAAAAAVLMSRSLPEAYDVFIGEVELKLN